MKNSREGSDWLVTSQSSWLREMGWSFGGGGETMTGLRQADQLVYFASDDPDC